MFNNYFTLYKLIAEFKPILEGLKLIDAFSQEKNKLVLRFANLHSSEESIFNIEICVNPNKPYLLIRNKYHRAGKNSLTFFSEFLGSRLLTVSIADYERIIRFNFNEFAVYILFRGPASNVVLVKEQKIISSFKQSENEVLSQIEIDIINSSFSIELPCLNIKEPLNYDSLSLRRLFPFFSPKIIKELRIRTEQNRIDLTESGVNDFISEILDEEFIISEDPVSKDLLMIPKTFTFDSGQRIIKKDTLNLLIYEVIRRESINKKFVNLFTSLKKYCDKSLEQSANKLNQLRNRIEKDSREEEYNRYGQLLLINLNSINSVSEAVTLEDVFTDGEQVTIPLKKQLTIKENATLYFEKSKEERTRYKKSVILFEEEEKKFNKLKQIEIKLKSIQSIDELNDLSKELGVSSREQDNKENEISSKFRHFCINGKYDVYVGKDSDSNDLLTMKFAKQNDYWFHARGYAGSHVVLRVNNLKEGIPKEIIKKAAAIAAFYSKGKTSKLVPVSYTFKKYVTKKKGMNPGQVALMREEVVMVKPGIEEEN